MDTEKYRALLTALETGSLTAAAEKLNYTASGISRMIAALEKELGFPLLLRRHEGVTPTRECQTLLPAIRNFVFAGDACLQTAAQLRGLEAGTITIGTAYSAYYVPLSRLIAAFRAEHPGVTVKLKNGYSTELARQLLDRRIDLCLISRREGTFTWLPLCEDEVVAMVPRGSALAREEAVPLTAFCQEPYIDILPNLDAPAHAADRQSPESDNALIFRSCGLTPNTQFTVTDNVLAWSMVEAGLGIAMNNSLNSRSLQGDVVFRPLKPRQVMEIGVAAQTDCAPLAAAFLDFLRARPELLELH